MVNTGVTARAQESVGLAWKCLGYGSCPSNRLLLTAFVEFSLFLTSALVFSNTGIMRWINSPVCKEMGKVWLWLKLTQGIKGVRAGQGDELWDRSPGIQTGVPWRFQASRSLLQVWDQVSPAPQGDIFLSRICKSILCFPLPTQESLKLGRVSGRDTCPTFSMIPHCSPLFETLAD